MSWVMVSVWSLRNSSQVHRRGLSISPVIDNDQSVNGVLGVGPADSTGKSVTRYWPGGRRPAGASSLGRPRKAREMKLMVASSRPRFERGMDRYSCTEDRPAGSGECSVM